MLSDGPKKRYIQYMANIPGIGIPGGSAIVGNFTSREYTMERYGDKYSFRFNDGYLSSHIEGTTKEIAYAIYKDYIGQAPDGYGVIKEWGYGPFYLEETKETGKWEVTLLLDTIKPEPEQQFWDELNQQINRFFQLTIFT